MTPFEMAEPRSLREAQRGQSFQFERHGYFIADARDRAFNRSVTLRDSRNTAR